MVINTSTERLNVVKTDQILHKHHASIFPCWMLDADLVGPLFKLKIICLV